VNNRALPYLSVTEINTLLKAKFEEDDDLHGLFIQGEISSWKSYPNATYFDLKDDKSVLSCILWGTASLYLPFEPKIGDLVLVRGDLSVYPPRGRYSLMCSSIELAGLGNQLLALEALKKKLQSEGLFDESRKRAIPKFPKAIGIIVGKGSAAEADLLKNLNRRWPISELYFFPSLVQGKEAPKDLLRVLKLALSYPLDTLIIARGGGSNEDLSAFNDESFVRAVAFSPVPTISAVGHESDTTLIDYVSDLRVSTPTGAAEAATPNQIDVLNGILQEGERLQNALLAEMASLSTRLDALSNRPFFKNPAAPYDEKEKEVEELNKRLYLAISRSLDSDKDEVKALKEHLRALNPESVLSRGYSLTRNKEGKILSSVKDVKSGEEIETKLKDGIIHSVAK
jgi:exodeoxyribonuclease VII large subunit